MKQKIQWNVKKLKEIMDAGNVKQKDIAVKINESTQVVSYYFRSSPTIYTASKIAHGLSTKDNAISWRDLIE